MRYRLSYSSPLPSFWAAHVREMALQLVAEALTSKLVALTVESGAAVMFIQEVTVSGTDPAPTPRLSSLVASSYQWSARPRLLILYRTWALESVEASRGVTSRNDVWSEPELSLIHI